jgi:hypothetical protein
VSLSIRPKYESSPYILSPDFVRACQRFRGACTDHYVLPWGLQQIVFSRGHFCMGLERSMNLLSFKYNLGCCDVSWDKL